MAVNKTTETDASVEDFISMVENEQQRIDCFRLIDIFRDVSGFEPKIWGSSIIGFGQYHYKYASGHEGDAPLIGFSPRKNQISLYMCPDLSGAMHLIEKFGKHKLGKGCIYIKKLSDINEHALRDIAKYTINFLNKLYS